MRYLKVVVVNVLVTLMLTVTLDLAVTMPSFERGAISKGVTCASSLTLYDYCPDIVHFRYMDTRDRLLPVYNYIDGNRQATYASLRLKPEVTQTSKIFLIGDSFIQAEELFIEERLEHRFRRQGYDTFARGYSSWNSIQFARLAAGLKVKAGDVVFVFSMANDFTPDYSRSAVRTEIREVSDEKRTLSAQPLLSSYLEQSFLNNRLPLLAANLFSQVGDSGPTSPITETHDVHNSADCGSLPALEDAASPLAHNYLELSKQANCWSERTRQSVDLNVELLQEMIAALAAQGAETYVVLVPAGWAFTNQNTVGRLSDLYQFPSGLRVTHQGLYDYLRESGLPMVDMMNVLESAAREDNDLYFAVDGHWNERAHSLVFSALFALLEEKME